MDNNIRFPCVGVFFLNAGPQCWKIGDFICHSKGETTPKSYFLHSWGYRFFATQCFASCFPCTCCWGFNVIVLCLTKSFTKSPCLCIYCSYLFCSSYFSLLIAFWRQWYLIMLSITLIMIGWFRKLMTILTFLLHQ